MSALNIGLFPSRGSGGVNFESLRASRANGDAGASSLPPARARGGFGGRQRSGCARLP